MGEVLRGQGVFTQTNIKHLIASLHTTRACVAPIPSPTLLVLDSSSCSWCWPRGQNALDLFLCMDTRVDQLLAGRNDPVSHEEVVRRRSLCIYALYHLYNGIRHNNYQTHE